MPGVENATVRIVRLSSLDVVPTEILNDTTKEAWGLVEIDGKVYKYDIRALIESYKEDPRVSLLVQQVASLTQLVNNLLKGIDENEEIIG